jgi:hypothetical protein
LPVVLLCVLSVASDKSKGTLPHGSADSYPPHAQKPGVAVGATLLNGKQVRQAFGVDLGNCCVVVEVALYPPKDETMKVSLSDFALISAGKEVGTMPSTPELVASLLEDRSYPVAREEQKGVQTHSGVGYESGGYDPRTGQRNPGGISTSSGVGVGVGDPPTHAGRSPDYLPTDWHSGFVRWRETRGFVTGWQWDCLGKLTGNSSHSTGLRLEQEMQCAKLQSCRAAFV